MEIPRLTQFSPGAGCGCKISPAQLHQILASSEKARIFPSLLVGNESSDDAAVLDLGNGTAVVSTTDFFTPIVDDPYDFGRIAATNAISDVYAMGGKPVMAIAILGWPLDKLPTETASLVLDGARAVCTQAGIPLAGGHSIDISDPIFGLAVTGILPVKNLKKNATAVPGCSLFLTKPLGVGIITTAEKRGLAEEPDRLAALELMTRLNDAGSWFGEISAVKAMTDVTGFGLAGHLLEMCEGSGCDALLNWETVPKMKNLEKYLEQKTIPGGTNRNFKSYGNKVSEIPPQVKNVLCDPQTSGGLLIAVDEKEHPTFIQEAENRNISLFRIGEMNVTGNETVRITVTNC